MNTTLLWIIFMLWTGGLLILFFSQQKEAIALKIIKREDRIDGVNLLRRPWGLKTKELKALAEKGHPEVKLIVKQVIFLRIVGFRFIWLSLFLMLVLALTSIVS